MSIQRFCPQKQRKSGGKGDVVVASTAAAAARAAEAARGRGGDAKGGAMDASAAHDAGVKAGGEAGGEVDASQPVEPWEGIPTRELAAKVKRRIEWLQQALQGLQEQTAGDRGRTKNLEDAESAKRRRAMRRLQNEVERLTSWKTVADFHLGLALGVHETDMFYAFEPFLQSHKPTMANKFHQGAERSILIDGETNEHFTFMRVLNEAGSEEERRSIFLCEAVEPAAGGAPPRSFMAVIKCLKKSKDALERDRLHYKREFVAHTIASGFSHPNILPLHRHYEAQGIDYVALPFVESCLFEQVTVQYRYKRRGFEEPATRRLLRQMYTAVCFLSNLGLVHRDLSLENFVVSGDGKVMLIDFGLCQPLALEDAESGKWKRSPNSFAGKVYYMAPEVFDQSSGDEVDLIAADVWSLGICLFIIVAGVYPFRCPNHSCERFRRLASRGVASLLRGHIRSGDISDLQVSDAFLDLIERMLKVDPAQRITLLEMRTHPFIVGS